MITIHEINKYYNKGKDNEIHVIRNTSFEFPKTGLFCLLGPSGSGKTTLLNVIGGLDRLDSGRITVDNQIMEKYKPKAWDLLRNRYFGYIFQNYVLFPQYTVYENLEFVLKMLNLDKEEIPKRIEYALKAVGMLRFKKRRPTQLSGGEQQRVAIARALVKSPEVVIADEPTGNLDEKNTHLIMNIIKKISQECLVILVTHERGLAEIYGDTIIELADGKIIGQHNANSDTEEISIDDQNLYLQDLNQAKTNADNLSLRYYYENENPKIALSIVYKNNTLFIQTEPDSLNVKILNQKSDIKIIDSKKPIINKESINAFEYTLPKIPRNRKKSALSYKDTFKIARRQIKGMNRKQKSSFLVFSLAFIMVLMGFVNLFSTRVNEPEFDNDRNLIRIEPDSHYYESTNGIDASDLEQKLGTKILWRDSTLKFAFLDVNTFSQFVPSVRIPPHTLFPIDSIPNPNLYMGRLPEKLGEIALDKFLIERMIQDKEYKSKGMIYPEQFIGASYHNHYINQEGTVVGIIDSNNPNIYVTSKEYMLCANNDGVDFIWDNMTIDTLTDLTGYYDLNEFRIHETESQLLPFPDLAHHQVLINRRYLNRVKEDGIISFGKEDYQVIGICSDTLTGLIIDEGDLQELMYDIIYSSKNPVCVYAKDKKAMMKKIDSLGFRNLDLYEYQYNLEEATVFNKYIYFFSLVILGASMVFFYFLMRSRLISRIYEVGVYRALGVKKLNIYKLFASEIALITLLTSIFGIVAVTLTVVEVNRIISIFYYPWYIIFIALGCTLLCNLFAGLLPVRKLLKLTPTQILTKYDI